MGAYTQTNTFSNGTTADGGQVNTEIVALGSSVNDIVNAQINTSAAIAESKLASGVRVRCSQRSGGSATDWNTAGTTTRSVATPFLQCGTTTSGGTESTTGSFRYTETTVTFPSAFTAKPLVWAVPMANTCWARVGTITTTTAVVSLQSLNSDAGTTNNTQFAWFAVGE